MIEIKSILDALEDFNKYDTPAKNDKEAIETVGENTGEIWNAEFLQ